MIASSQEARELVSEKCKEFQEATGNVADPWIIAENLAQDLINERRNAEIKRAQNGADRLDRVVEVMRRS